MKKQLLFLVLMLLPVVAKAYDAYIDGIYYNFSGDEAKVTYMEISKITYDYISNYSGSVVIPSSVTYNSKTYSVTSIDDYAFYHCSGLTSVTIPNCVTSIGSAAFAGCSSLNSVTIPNSVTIIGDFAFFNCKSLTSITIPDSVTIIGKDAFYQCSNLTSVTIGNSVTSIESSAFSNCTSLTSITIPNSVTSIGNSAFSGCSGLISITIPNNVTSIGEWAFSGCSGLTSLKVETGNTTYDSRNDCNAIIETASNTLISGCRNTTIPESVTSIGGNAFYGCNSLTSITIPNSVTSIGTCAFYDCSGLTSITIPSSVTSIGDGAFYACSGLISIAIPNSVFSIGNYAFSRCSGLTSVTIPNSVTNIGEGAFSGCSGLTSVTVSIDDLDTFCNNIIISQIGMPIKLVDSDGKEITDYIVPDNVTSIGDYAFRNCSGLTSIIIPNSVTSIGKEAFSGCNGLTSIIIPNSVTIIGISAFSNCSVLTSVTIGNGVTSISNRTFYGCSGLTSITIPNYVTSIGEEVFYGCSGLTSINIPESVTSIGNRTFYGCSGLTSINIPEGITSIGNRTFYGCSGLASINIPNSVTSIGEEVFTGCSGLTSVTIGNGVTSIGNRAFSDCSNLTSVSILENVTSIGDRAFSGCTSLTSVTLESEAIVSASRTSTNSMKSIFGEQVKSYIIGDAVKSIGNYAFYNCINLTSITIPNSVTSIGSRAFSGCSGLTSVTIPESVTSIDNYAFYGCNGLTSVEVRMETPVAIKKNTFSNNTYATLLVPPGCISAYSAADYWNEFREIKEYQPKLDGIYYKLNTDNKVAEVTTSPDDDKYTGYLTIPSSIKYKDQTYTVTSISKGAFYGCSGLTSITIPNSVTSIGGNAFYGCNSLTSITIPNSVTSIGYGAFYNCNNLTSVSIGNGVTSIGYETFRGCSNLNTLIIGSGINEIGSSAFYGCKLHSIFIKCDTPPAVSSSSTFSDQTYNHSTLYIPTDSWDSYAYDNFWYRFNNIRETATAEGQLSMQQAYTLMDANKFTYSVYDMVNNCISTTNADGIDENNPNHSWQLMKANGNYYLYNIGAKKYVQKNGSGFDLIDTPRPINVENGDNGIILGAQTSQQWALVSNGHVNVLQSAIDEITSIGTKVDMVISNAGYSTFYDSRYSYTLPNGLSAQVVTNESNGKLTYYTIAEGKTAGIVPKGTAVMLVSDSKHSGTFSLTITAENVPYSGTNLLCGSDETTMTSGNGLHYKLSYGQTGTRWNDVFGWYWGAQNGAPFQIDGHKAWLVVSGGSTRAAGFTIDGDATEIIDIASDSEGYDIYYDVQGRRISTPTRSGLYIKNGKKVIIK